MKKTNDILPASVSQWEKAIKLMVAQQKNYIARRTYDNMPSFKRFCLSIIGKKPAEWNINLTEGYMNRFVDCAQKSFGVGKRMDYVVDNDNRSFHIGIRYDAASLYPVLSVTYTYHGMIFQERKLVTHHGVTDWGIRAPYDELGMSGRPDPSYIEDDEIAKKGYRKFDSIVNCVENQIVSAFNS